MTELATIGTAGDAIAHLTISKDAQAHLTNQIPVAFAVTYLVGVIVAAWFLSQIGPRILGVDLAAECRAYEEKMTGGEGKGSLLAWRKFDIRIYRLDPGSKIVGCSIPEVEKMIENARIHVDRVRRGEKVESPGADFILAAGDVIAVAGRHEVLIEEGHVFGTELADSDLVQDEIDAVDLVVTKKEIDGMTLLELAGKPYARGVFLRGISRSGVAIPVAPATVIDRGDVLSIVGMPDRTKAAITALGIADRVTDVTDMVFVGLGIVLGALVGLPAIRYGALELGLSESVGVLLGGLVFGWLRSVRPELGRIPSPTLWLFESLGLTGFVAVVGLSAGPDFVRGLQESRIVAPNCRAGGRCNRPLCSIIGWQVCLRYASGNPLRRLRRSRHSDARARGSAGSGEKCSAHLGIRRKLCGGKCISCAMGHCNCVHAPMRYRF